MSPPQYRARSTPVFGRAAGGRRGRTVGWQRLGPGADSRPCFFFITSSVVLDIPSTSSLSLKSRWHKDVTSRPQDSAPGTVLGSGTQCGDSAGHSTGCVRMFNKYWPQSLKLVKRRDEMLTPCRFGSPPPGFPMSLRLCYKEFPIPGGDRLQMLLSKCLRMAPWEALCEPLSRSCDPQPFCLPAPLWGHLQTQSPAPPHTRTLWPEIHHNPGLQKET